MSALPGRFYSFDMWVNHKRSSSLNIEMLGYSQDSGVSRQSVWSCDLDGFVVGVFVVVVSGPNVHSDVGTCLSFRK